MTDYSFLNNLEQIIKKHKNSDPNASYTAKLYQKNINKIAQKFGEEAVEVVVAAVNESNERFSSEVADLLYHLFLLIEKKHGNFADIIQELENRNK